MDNSERQKEIEQLLGRPLKDTEIRIFNLFKKDPNFTFTKDPFGNLKVIEVKII